jgi:hypothetical protein
MIWPHVSIKNTEKNVFLKMSVIDNKRGQRLLMKEKAKLVERIKDSPATGSQLVARMI